MISLRVGVLSGHGNGEHVLAGIGEHVRRSCEGWVTEGERQRGDHGHTDSKLLNEVVLGQVKHLRAEDRSIVVNREDNETVGKWPDAKLGKQGSLRGADLVALLNELHRGDDFDGTLVNLGGNVQHLYFQTPTLRVTTNTYTNALMFN